MSPTAWGEYARADLQRANQRDRRDSAWIAWYVRRTLRAIGARIAA